MNKVNLFAALAPVTKIPKNQQGMNLLENNILGGKLGACMAFELSGALGEW